ncbi:hypothetical protein E4U26_008015 [Claviceps purpurea]|nr:hypothetical protein E4U26_008015 [Claviceps purpurea]
MAFRNQELAGSERWMGAPAILRIQSLLSATLGQYPVVARRYMGCRKTIDPKKRPFLVLFSASIGTKVDCSPGCRVVVQVVARLCGVPSHMENSHRLAEERFADSHILVLLTACGVRHSHITTETNRRVVFVMTYAMSHVAETGKREKTRTRLQTLAVAPRLPLLTSGCGAA